MGTGSFPGVKRPGRGVDQPPPYSAEVKERVLLLPHLRAFMACSRATFTFFFTSDPKLREKQSYKVLHFVQQFPLTYQQGLIEAHIPN